MNPTQARIYAVQAIEHERERQTYQWGKQHDDEHDAHAWTVLLTKHIGRLANSVMEGDGDLYRRTIVVGALALAFAEWQKLRPARARDHDLR